MISKKGLKSFTNKLDKLKNLKEDKLSKKVAQEALIHLKSLYDDELVYCLIQPKGMTQYRLSAYSSQIAYIEYGTGLIGQGTYKGNLPTQVLTFESPKKSGRINTTNGWVYNYPNPITKPTGTGWTYNNQYTEGQVAKGQMWNTSIWIRENAVRIIKESLSD